MRTRCGLDGSRVRRSCRACRACRACALRVVSVVRSQPVAFVRFCFRELRLRPAALIGIFLAVDRSNMRRISIEIRSPDPELFAVRIDPLPQYLTGTQSLRTRCALDAHEIGRKPVAIAAPAAPAMV